MTKNRTNPLRLLHRTTLPLVSLALLALIACDRTQPAQETTRVVKTSPPLTIDFSKRGDAAAAAVPRPAAAGVAPSAFCPMYAETVCRKLFACAEPEVIAVDAAAHQFSDEASCRAGLGRFCGKLMLGGVEESVAAGRVRWDAKSFGRCFNTWIEQACAQPWGDLPDRADCREASRGTVTPGGSCTTAFDCAEVEGAEIVCAFPESGPGTCAQLGGRGAPCEFSNACQSALRCRQGTCQPPGQEGEPCRFKDDCAAGLLCAEAGTCHNPLKR